MGFQDWRYARAPQAPCGGVLNGDDDYKRMSATAWPRSDWDWRCARALQRARDLPCGGVLNGDDH